MEPWLKKGKLLSTRQDPEKTDINIETRFIMTKGKVKWYNEIKGFGFIASENGDDIFVHRTGLFSSTPVLQPEQEVVFDIKQGDKGLIAVDVKLAD